MNIEISGNPIEHAFNAYYSGYAIEAIQTIHGHLESVVQALMFSIGAQYSENEFDDYIQAQNASQEISLIHGIKVLFIQRVISREEYESIKRFNSTRNKIIHQIFMDKFFKKKHPVSSDKFEKILHTGADITNTLTLTHLCRQ